MKRNLRYFLVVAAFTGMGFSMPSCPGQEKLQTQIDTLQSTNLDLNRKVHTLTTQVSSLNNDMSQVKDLLSRITTVIEAQKTAMTELDATITQMKSKPGHKPAPARK